MPRLAADISKLIEAPGTVYGSAAVHANSQKWQGESIVTGASVFGVLAHAQTQLQQTARPPHFELDRDLQRQEPGHASGWRIRSCF